MCHSKPEPDELAILSCLEAMEQRLMSRIKAFEDQQWRDKRFLAARMDRFNESLRRIGQDAADISSKVAAQSGKISGLEGRLIEVSDKVAKQEQDVHSELSRMREGMRSELGRMQNGIREGQKLFWSNPTQAARGRTRGMRRPSQTGTARGFNVSRSQPKIHLQRVSSRDDH